MTVIQKAFFKEIGHDSGFRHLFDQLDRVSFFLKNRKFQIVHANAQFYERLGFREEKQLVGKDDFELFPEPLARKFRADDERVLSTGEAMPSMIELFLNRQGLPDWYRTNKHAIIGKSGQPIGVMGTVQRYDQHRALTSSHPAVARAVVKMLEQPGEIESLREFAQSLGMSHRNFDRRFKEDTGLTPKQYLGRARIQRACQILQKTDVQLGELAMSLGYCDQSAFTAQFRKQMGLTPLKYRRQFGK